MKRRRWHTDFVRVFGLMVLSVSVVEGCTSGPHYVTPAVGLAQAPAGGTEPIVEKVKAPPAASEQPGQAAPEAVVQVPRMAANTNRKHFDPQQVRPIIEDPRLAQVKKERDDERPKAAAEAMARAVDGLDKDDPLRASWTYQTGVLWMAAGQPARAVDAFDRVATTGFALAHYARLHAARALLGLKQPGEALARLEDIDDSWFDGASVTRDEALLMRARALAATRQVDKAAVLWRSYLNRKPRAGGWRHVALRFARALINQPSEERAAEAIEVARLVIHESRAGRGAGEAREIEKRALASLPSKRRSAFTALDLQARVTQARALAESGQARQALYAAERLLEELKAKSGADAKPSEHSCEAYIAQGRALTTLRRHAEASDAFGLARLRCAGHPRLLYALFLGGRSALRAGRPAAARTRYEDLERHFGTHRFADDARLEGARAAAKLGDDAAFTRMLSRIADDYPKGDMIEDGLFALALARMKEGNWAAAVGPLERASRLTGMRAYYARGRAAYFLSRARLKLGQRAEALDGFESVIRRYPLSYYMVQAYSRLRALDPKRAKGALASALAREPRGDFVIEDHPSLHTDGFRRALLLSQQGDARRAYQELRVALESDPPPALLWASAFILAQTEAAAESHQVLSAAPTEWQKHYPEGVWKQIWNIAYPRPYADIVAKERKRSPIPEHLAYAIMREESAFRPTVMSHASAHGLMQLIVPTAKSVGRKLGMKVTRKSLDEPEVNIALGCRFLDMLSKRFAYNPLLAIAGYNAGPGAPRRWVKRREVDDFDLFVELIPYRETRRYTKRVIRSMAAYASLYGDGMDGAWLDLPAFVAPHDKP